LFIFNHYKLILRANKEKIGEEMNAKVEQATFVIEKVRHLTESTYVLRFSRNEMKFSPGQHLVLGLPGSTELREYSIYSGVNDDFLEVLIKEVDEGLVSRQLKNIRSGDQLEVRGPYGFFLTRASKQDPGGVLFISSGTGIAPFHSFVRSFPESDYRLIHGVRNLEEGYDLDHYERAYITLCTSRDDQGDFSGRLTDHLLEAELDPERDVYLCGNSNMIFDAMDILRARGIPQNQIFTEVYF
jgi:ferredoxin--NADP+ reductase/benzoate/toluate 1,2-dioxygenase reductase subunit